MALPSLVAFDFDGTLVDSRDAVSDTLNDVLARHLLPRVEPAWVHGQLGQPLGAILRRAIPEHQLPIDLAPLEAAYHAAFLTLGVPQVQAFAGAHALLAHLRAAGVRTALVTNRARRSLEAVLAHVGLAGAFDHVVSSDDVEAGKPDPEGLLRVLEVLGVPPETARFVGDAGVDLAAGRAAGVDTLLVRHGRARLPGVVEGDGEVVDGLVDVLAWLGAGADEVVRD